jgi:hypothetical protein
MAHYPTVAAQNQRQARRDAHCMILVGGGPAAYFTSARQNLSIRSSPFSMLAMLVA